MNGVIIAVACHDTAENGRTEFTKRTMVQLLKTVDLTKHKLVVINNASCSETFRFLETFVNSNTFAGTDNAVLINKAENAGTAAAINEAIRLRAKGQHVIKIDNDMLIHKRGWVEEMVTALESPNEFKLGVIGVKRWDLIQNPYHENPTYRTYYHEYMDGTIKRKMEICPDIIGSCTIFNSDLLDIIGYERQPTKYGLEDCDICVRSQIAGFTNAFLPHLPVEHIDEEENPYWEWKKQQAALAWDEYRATINGYMDGSIDIYYDGGF